MMATRGKHAVALPVKARVGLSAWVILLALLASGCIRTGQSKLLEPSALGGIGEVGYEDDRVTTPWRVADTVRLAAQPDVGITVRICNREEVGAVAVGPFFPIVPWPPGIFRAFRTDVRPPLVVFVGFDAADSLSLDVRQVHLRAGDGEEVTAAAFGWQIGQPLCSFAPDQPLADEHIRVMSTGAVALRFDLETLPLPGLRLHLDGLSGPDGAVTLPPIELRQATEWMFYWFSS